MSLFWLAVYLCVAVYWLTVFVLVIRLGVWAMLYWRAKLAPPRSSLLRTVCELVALFAAWRFSPNLLVSVGVLVVVIVAELVARSDATETVRGRRRQPLMRTTSHN